MIGIRRTLVSLHLLLLQRYHTPPISSAAAFQISIPAEKQHRPSLSIVRQRHRRYASYSTQQQRMEDSNIKQSDASVKPSSILNSNNDVVSSDYISQQQQQCPVFDEKHVEKVLFVECGFGSDAHGQNSTKAAVRACRNAIEFNQIPCIGELIPGGRENMKLDVLLGVPMKYQKDLDLTAIRQCFPYGKVHIQCPPEGGGLVASSGKVIAEMGDTNDDMIIVCVAVTVGY